MDKRTKPPGRRPFDVIDIHQPIHYVPGDPEALFALAERGLAARAARVQSGTVRAELAE